MSISWKIKQILSHLQFHIKKAQLSLKQGHFLKSLSIMTCWTSGVMISLLIGWRDEYGRYKEL
jgi:hypothetical protein